VSILQTPHHKIIGDDDIVNIEGSKNKKPRHSPRLQAQKTKNTPIIKRAQELITRKCGIIKEGEDLENCTLQNYLDLYKQPLLNESLEAIMKLSVVADEKKKKKVKNAKKKSLEVNAPIKGGAIKGKKSQEKLIKASKIGPSELAAEAT
jgi:hypothetical protein